MIGFETNEEERKQARRNVRKGERRTKNCCMNHEHQAQINHSAANNITQLIVSRGSGTAAAGFKSHQNNQVDKR